MPNYGSIFNRFFDNAPDYYDVQPQYGDGGFLDSSINALATGLGGTLEGAGTYLNQELGFGEGLANLGHDMQIGRQARTDWDMNKAMADPLGFITDPSGLTYNAFNLIGSSAPDLAITAAASVATGGIGGLAVGAGLKAAKAARLAKAASGLEKAMEVGSKAEGIGLRGAQLIKEYAPTVAGNIAGGAFDAATEAGSTYTAALENGATEDEARNAMQTDFINNIGMSTIQNAISMNMLKGAVKTPLGIGRKEIGDAAEASGKGLLGAMSEAGGKVADFADNHFATRLMTRAVPGTAVEAYTEGLQNEFQDNAVHGYNVNYNPFDMSDESKNQMFMAAVGMLPQGILGATRRRRVRAEENMADSNIDKGTIQNENAEPEVIATPEENVDDGSINENVAEQLTEDAIQNGNVDPEVIANPVENIISPENEAIEGNAPVTTNEQAEPPSFATIYDSYINDRDPINNRTSEQLAIDRSNEAEDMGYNTEDKKGQLRAVQDMADTIEALDTNENSPLKQIGIKKPDIGKYIKNNFTNDVADTVAGGDKAVARNTLNQVADVLYYRNKKAEPERRRAANQAEAEQLTKEGGLFGLGPVPQSDNGEYTRKSINGYKQKIASTKNRIDKEHNHFKLAKERQDHVPDESQFAKSLSQAVDANDREQFVKDVNQSINELSSYTTTPAQSLNRITNYFHTKTQKDAVRKAFVGYYNDRVNGSKGFKFDINKHLKAANNIVNIKNKEELPAPKKMTIGQQRNSAIREARTSISNIKYKLRDMEDPALKGTSNKIEERIQQLEDRIKKSTNKSEITHLKQLQNVFLSGKKAIEVEHKRREKAIGKKNKQKGKLAKKGKAGKRKTVAKQKIDAFNKKMEDEKNNAQAKEEPTKDIVEEKETTTVQKQEPAKKKLPPKKKVEVDNASDDDINSVASRLWNYHRDHKQFNKQLHKRNGKYHIKDDKGNDYYYSEAVGNRIKSKYNELREAHFKEHPEDKATVTQAAAKRAQSRKANSQQKLEEAVNNENKKDTAEKFVEHQKNFSILVKNKSLFNDETPIDYLDDVKQKYKDGMSKDKKIREAIMPNRRGWINNIFDAFGKEFVKYNSVDVYKLAEHKKFNNGVARLKSLYNAFTDNGKPIDKDIIIPQSVRLAMEYSGAGYDKVSASNVLKLTDVEKSGVPKNILDKAIKEAELIDSQKKLNNKKASEKVKPIFGDNKMSAKVTYDGGKPIEISYNGDIKAVVELKNIDEFNKLGEFDKPRYINKYLPDGYDADEIEDVKGNTVTATLVYYKELNNDTHFIDKQIYDKLSEEDKRKLEENGIKAEDTEGGSEDENKGHRGSTDRPSGTAKENSENNNGIHKRVRGTVQNPDASRQKESDLAGVRTRPRGLELHNESTQTGESKTRERKQQIDILQSSKDIDSSKSVSKNIVDKALESMFYGMSPTRKKEATKLLKDTGVKIRIVPELIVEDNGEDRKVGGAYFEDPGILALAESRIKSDIENGRIINDPASAHEYGHFILELLRQGGKSLVQWEGFFNKIISKDLELSGAKNLQELVDADTEALVNVYGKEYTNQIEKFVKEAIAEGKPPDDIAIEVGKLHIKKWPERPSENIDKNIIIPQSVRLAMEYSGAGYDKVSASNVLKLTDVEKSGVPKNILDKAIKEAELIDSQKKLNNKKASEKVKPIFGDNKMSAKVTYDGGKPIEISYNGDIKAVVELKNIDEFNKLGEFDKPRYINKYLPDGYDADEIEDVKGNTVTATLVYYKELNNDTHFIDKQIYDKLSEEDKRKLEENGIKAEDTEGGSKNGTVKHADNSGRNEKENELVQRTVTKGNNVGRIGSRINGGRSTQRSSGLPVENAQSVQKYREISPEVKQLYDNGNLKWDNDVTTEEVGNAIESMFYGAPESFKKTAVNLLNSMGIRVYITSKPIIANAKNGKEKAVGLYRESTGEMFISRDKINGQIKTNSIKTRPTSAHENEHFIFSILHKGPERDEAWRELFNDVIENDIKSTGVKNINELVTKENKVFTDEGIKEIDGFVAEILSGKSPSEKLKGRYYRTDNPINGRIINAVLHRIALDDHHILKLVRDPNYFQELMVAKNTYEVNCRIGSLEI